MVLGSVLGLRDTILEKFIVPPVVELTMLGKDFADYLK